MFRGDLRGGKPRRGARGAGGSPAGRKGRVPRSPTTNTAAEASAFVLYVEGPRDLEILGHWAKRLDPALARCIEAKTVILGGKQPARAISDFRKRDVADGERAGLILLDRDHHGHDDHDAFRAQASEVGLEVFVWSLRHIESYLLVPDVLRRVLGLASDDRRVEALIEASGRTALLDREDHAGQSVRDGAEAMHAKRVIGAGGALFESFGVEVRAGEIARAMRSSELHADIHSLFERVRVLSGLDKRSGPELEVIVRGAPFASRD